MLKKAGKNIKAIKISRFAFGAEGGAYPLS
jgi:hypothetical protein